jgi:deoxyribonuclease-4
LLSKKKNVNISSGLNSLKKYMPIIGAHVSVAGGLFNCFANAKKIGAECIQIFGSAPQQWKTSFPAEEAIKKFKSEQKKTGIKPVFLHASYLVNLGSPDNRIFYGSIKNLGEHYQIAESLGANGLIFHTGSAKGGNKEEAIKHVAKGIKLILEENKGKAWLVLENSSGGGDKIGVTLEEIGKIYQAVDDPRLKICFDTAHGFEAGIFEKFSIEELDQFVEKCDKLFSWKNVVAMHINDSKTKFKSNHDRHANIGDGYIGLEAFRNLATHRGFNKLPWILEVPGFDDNGPDKKNISILHSLLTKPV